MGENNESSGGTTPTTFPHKCPFSVIGTTRASCKAFTSDRERNWRCVESNCNSELRICKMCIREVATEMMGRVVDPVKGLCATHQKRVEFQKRRTESESDLVHTDASVARQRPTAVKKVRRKIVGVAVEDTTIIDRALALVQTLTDQHMRIFLELPNGDETIITKKFRITEGTLNVHLSHLYKHLRLNTLRQQDKRPTLLKVATLYAERSKAQP